MQVREKDKILKKKLQQAKGEPIQEKNRFDEDLLELLGFDELDENLTKKHQKIIEDMNKPILYKNLGDFLKTILGKNFDKLEFDKKILDYTNVDKGFTVPDLINETAKIFFNEDLDGNELLAGIEEMFFNLGLSNFVGIVKLKSANSANDNIKNIQKQNSKSSNLDFIDGSAILRKFNEKLDKIEISKLFDSLLKKDFSLEEISILASLFFRTVNRVNDGNLALLGSGKSAGALVHLINLASLELTGRKFKTFQVDIQDPSQIEISIGSKTYYPNNDKLLLIDFSLLALSYSYGLLNIKLQIPVPKNYFNSRIVYTLAVVKSNDDNRHDFEDENMKYLQSPFDKDEKFEGNIISMKSEIEILKKTIEKYSKLSIQKDFFFQEKFYSQFDLDLILQNTNYLFIAAKILFEEIREDLDLKDLEKIYINYTTDKEFSLIFALGLFLKYFYPHLDVITDEESILNYDKNKDKKSVLIDVGLKRNIYNENILGIEGPYGNTTKKFDYVYSIYSDKIRIQI